MSHMCHMGVIASMTSTVSLKNRSIMGHRLNHCAFLRLVQLRGWGNCPVCDSGRSPTVNGSLISGRFTKCSGTGLHRNPMDGLPGGGISMLRDDSKTLFFIVMQSIAILFTTPSLSQ